MSFKIFGATCGLYVALCTCQAFASPTDIVYDTTPFWTGGSVAALGGNGVSAYGQTFVAPAGYKLDSFTYFIDEFNTGPSVSVQGYVSRWNPATTRPTGPILFTSPVISSTNNHGQGGWETVNVNTGGLLLEAGSTYIAFLGTFGLFTSLNDELKVGLTNGNVFSGGQFYYFGHNATNAQLSNISTVPWDTLSAGSPAGIDLAFRMNFSVPEPATLSLAACGLVAGGLCIWRRRLQLRGGNTALAGSSR